MPWSSMAKRCSSKGANWIPADAVYARVSDERYDTLVREARDANFTMLRIWGGGLYERDAFYQACDRYGIMIWHDFMFACAPYPDHLESFRQEVAKEADYQTRRLQRHACIVLWSGSNENNWGFRDWWDEQTRGGAWTYNYCLPDTVQRNCPEIPTGTARPMAARSPIASDVGDRHHWHDCMMNPDMNKRITPEEYDLCTSLFVSEYGYIGPPALESILTYMDGAPLDRQSRVWQHHNNTFEQDTVEAGIRKHYADPENLTLDEYLLYSGLCQGLMYSYSLDSMRYRDNCYGSLFWMYDDTWGEVGWTIVDYYLRRKLSWWFVRRAFAPLRLITRDAQTLRAAPSKTARSASSWPTTPRTRSRSSSSMAMSAWTAARAICIARPYRPRPCPAPRCASLLGASTIPRAACGSRARQTESTSTPPSIARSTIGSWRPPIPRLNLAIVDTQAKSCTVRVSAQGYAHAVHLDLPAGAVPSDDYFDLLPGESRDIQIISSEPLDHSTISVTCVNEH